jgi:DHA2 family multidrug resistance protein
MSHLFPEPADDSALRMLDAQLMRQAGMLAYNHVFLLVAYLFVIAIPLIFLLRHGRGGAAGNIVID